MIEITQKPISPETVVNRVKTDASGCVAAYVGLIRNLSQGKQVVAVEYQDANGQAKDTLERIAGEIRLKWKVEDIAICHRVGRLEVGEINFMTAVAAAHREEGFAAAQYAVDRFKELLPTRKREIYSDGTVKVSGE